ncbi:hypothetical protein Q8791_09320 [Nocardiopsis sp. CT-R113]|uniref:DUF6892 domain-containing protein n=1 Tax=Nocardiopsis codii TaxID=3065942 RepID=A0ABU7K592_9ACTN|nr:hypothetical protein [Nocardiopsis sp. CT-R113]MEE2037418.1 hypothetical protein [Nocardiopsis sp. CT-R113]
MPTFQDFNFKLLVIDRLMYDDETLSPPFNLSTHLRGLGITESAYDYARRTGKEYAVLDEARAYFEALEIGEDQLATVDTILFDGGNRVFMECAPIWDGEDDLFDVRSLDDLALVPNLRSFQNAEDLFYRQPEMLELLASRGIATD